MANRVIIHGGYLFKTEFICLRLEIQEESKLISVAVLMDS